ncbi:MAG: TetR/AcrR family transcriptional regulator [Actinomycetota bacterium]|nr:TetR/AcrR family transcriptional regulator [Actinomycetota bacterium]
MSEAVLSLSEAKRQAGYQHILTAARRAVIEQGLDITMDQMAESTSVSRRTLFRYFGSRERLIVDAFTAGMEGYAHQLPVFDGDRDGWLRATCLAAHRMNTGSGPGFWALTSRNDLPPELQELEKHRRGRQRAAAKSVARTLWQASGGVGGPPDGLTSCVLAHLCPYFTGAVTMEGGQSWHDAAELAFDAISGKLQGLLTQHERG